MKKLLFFILLGLSVLAGCRSNEPARTELLEVDGTHLHFGDLKGKWVVINYWASWCQPCNIEIPELNAFYQFNKNKDVVVLGVNYDNVDPTELKKIIAQQGITYPNLITDPSHSLGLGEIPGLPATYIFGPDGKLKDKLFGQQTRESLQKVIDVG